MGSEVIISKDYPTTTVPLESVDKPTEIEERDRSDGSYRGYHSQTGSLVYERLNERRNDFFLMYFYQALESISEAHLRPHSLGTLLCHCLRMAYTHAKNMFERLNMVAKYNCSSEPKVAFPPPRESHVARLMG